MDYIVELIRSNQSTLAFLAIPAAAALLAALTALACRLRRQ
jgi:hypothetical protein